jgi:hypothetical protein
MPEWESTNKGWCWKAKQGVSGDGWTLFQPGTAFCEIPGLPCYFSNQLGGDVFPAVAFCDSKIVSQYDLGTWANQHHIGRGGQGDDVRANIIPIQLTNSPIPYYEVFGIH